MCMCMHIYMYTARGSLLNKGLEVLHHLPIELSGIGRHSDAQLEIPETTLLFP